jgi:hypothetical protein
MNKIELPFIWSSDLESIALFSFPVDLEKLSSLEIECSEYPGFFIDLKDGKILGVSEEISSGFAYRYKNDENFLIEGRGWWFGYNSSEDEDYLQSSDPELTNLLSIHNFNTIVDSVCDYSRRNNLNNLKCTGLYAKYIDNEDAPSFI